MLTMLNGIYTTVGNFDDFVQRNKRRLKWRKLNKQLDGLVVVLLESVNLLTTTSQARVLITWLSFKVSK